MYKSDYAKFI